MRSIEYLIERQRELVKELIQVSMELVQHVAQRTTSCCNCPSPHHRLGNHEVCCGCSCHDKVR